MTTLDIIICAALAYGLIKGLFKGFFVEVASLLALVLGIYGALHFSFYASAILSSYTDMSEQYLSMCAFALTFIIIVLAISLAGKLLTKIASFAMLGWANKLLGGLFGFLKIALVLSVVLYFFNILNTSFEVVDQDSLESSVFYQPMSELTESLYPIVEEKIQSK
ncbi:MAG: CvpA family protein [Flavobacteriaceae bacterium]